MISQVAERSQCPKIDLLPGRSVGTVRQGFDVGRKVFDTLDLMLWQQDGAELGQVKPLIRSAFNATEVKIERVNVDIGLHCRAPKKQEPPPKERLRALLVEQSGVMMAKIVTNVRVVVNGMDFIAMPIQEDNSQRHQLEFHGLLPPRHRILKEERWDCPISLKDKGKG